MNNSSKVEKYCFVLCMNSSGSTVLEQLLTSSTHGISLGGEGREGRIVEGQLVVSPDVMYKPRNIPGRLWTNHVKKFSSDRTNDWEKIKTQWLTRWRQNRKYENTETPVFVEKSPPNIARYAKLKTLFPNPYFVAMIRDPYAVSEGNRRRKEHTTIEQGAKHWLVANKLLMKAVEAEKDAGHLAFLRYEDLCADPEKAKARIVSILPELADMDMSKTFTVRSIEPGPKPLTNLNDAQIARLSPEDIKAISAVLEPERAFIETLGYELR